MREPASGASRIVARPRTAIVQPAGARNVLPSTVVRFASAERRSGCGGASLVELALAPALVAVVGTVGFAGEPQATNRARVKRCARMSRTIHPFYISS